MKPKALRHLIIALLTVSGVFQLLLAMLGGAPGLAGPVAGFGALFVIIGFFVRADTKDGSRNHSRNAIIAAIIACLANAAFAVYAIPRTEGYIALLIVGLVDLAIVVAGVMWMTKMAAKKKR